MVFETNVLRRIFGATKERDGTWRIKTNDELDKLIRRENITNYLKAQRLSWFWPFTSNVGRENGKKSI
jgi:hypothetical protein